MRIWFVGACEVSGDSSEPRYVFTVECNGDEYLGRITKVERVSERVDLNKKRDREIQSLVGAEMDVRKLQIARKGEAIWLRDANFTLVTSALP